MRLSKRCLIAIVILFSLHDMNAQTDFPLSTLTSSPAQLNPASTGLFNDAFRIHSYFKSQMAQSLSGGIKGTGLAADYNFDRAGMGVGLAVYSNSVNRSALRDFNVLVSYAYRVNLSRWSLISLGLQGGFKQTGFSMEQLSFGSQYDPAYKGGYDPGKQPNYLLQGNKNSLDASAGAYWQGYLSPFFALKLGAAAFHLIPVKTDFLTEETYLKPKFVFNANGRFEGHYLHWVPSVMYVTQNNSGYTEAGLTVQLRDEDRFINVGCYYRTPNVMIPTLGIGFDKLSLNVSMEYYSGTNYSKIFNIGLSYVPQTNRKASLIEDYWSI